MNNPAMRFKRDDGTVFPDWSSSEIGNVADTCSGGTPSTSVSEYWDGPIQWLTPTEINSKYVHNSKRTITSAGIASSSAKLLPIGALLLTTRATIGSCSINNFDGDVSTNQGFQSLICKSSLFNEYAYYAITRDKFQKELIKHASGSTFLEISSKNLKKLPIPIPCLEEQQKIASFFSTLDQKIELNERKLEALEKLKKGLLRKIFSQNIRFKNSDGTNYLEWRTARFFDIVESIIDFRGRTPKKLGLDWAPSTTEYLALSALNVKNWGIDPSAEAHYGDEKLYKKWMTGKELHKGQVLLTTEAPAGIVMQIPDEKKYILSQRVIALNVKQDSISEVFLSQLLKSEKVQQDIRKLSTGGTAIGISQKSLRNLYLYFPSSIQEQQAIGNLFASLDNKLQLTKKRVEKLQALKRSFMQQMFV